MLKQRTLKSVVKAVGLGLHSGERVEMTLLPAPVNSGIVFCRVDLNPAVDIVVDALAVSDTRMASTLSHGGAKVQTVEHLMSACAGLGIDNLRIEMNAEEVPILDGSAAAFVYLLQSAGVELQNAPKQFIKVTQTVEVREGEGKDLKWARLSPHHGFKMGFEIDFGHPALDSTGQCAHYDTAKNQYSRDIARARTFGFTRDVEMLRARGLALGGGFDNAIVIDDYRILNSDGLRYEDEFARHKILDAMGDLYLIGKPLIASYEAYRSGHGLNNQLLRALIEQNAFELVSFDDVKSAPEGFEHSVNSW